MRDFQQLLNDTLLDAVVGFGPEDNGITDDQCEALVMGLVEAGVESSELKGWVEDRVIPMLIGRLEDRKEWEL